MLCPSYGDAQMAACSSLLLLLCEARADAMQLSAAGTTTTVPPTDAAPALWAAPGCDATDATLPELCAALRVVQAPEDPRGAVWLRAQQCLLVLEGRAGGRGEGMPLWGK